MSSHQKPIISLTQPPGPPPPTCLGPWGAFIPGEQAFMIGRIPLFPHATLPQGRSRPMEVSSPVLIPDYTEVGTLVTLLMGGFFYASPQC